MMIPFERLRHISSSDFAALGLQDVAYVKPVVVDGSPAFAIFAANGMPAGMVPTRDAALAAVREHGLEPVGVH